MEGPLAGLPGASTDAGQGPVVRSLLEGLLLAAEPVGRHRQALHAWYTDLVGPLLVHAAGTDTLQEQLEPGDRGLRVALVADPGPDDPAGLLGLRAARNQLLDDDRVELTGVHLALPGSTPSDVVVHELLADLDFTVPAWVELAPTAGWRQAMDAIAADGAERLAVRLPVDADGAGRVAEILRAAVDRDLSLRIPGVGPAPVPTGGVLAAIGAVRAALNGAEVPEIAAILVERTTTPLAAALRRMSDADAAVARVFLDGVVVGDTREAAADLAALGLVDVRPDA